MRGRGGYTLPLTGYWHARASESYLGRLAELVFITNEAGRVKDCQQIFSQPGTPLYFAPRTESPSVSHQ